MTEAQQVDPDYNHIDSFALEDESGTRAADEDQTVETHLIKKLRAYIKTAIAEHNTFDVINLPANASPGEKIAAFDMMAIHKGLIMHLRQLETEINNVVKEN